MGRRYKTKQSREQGELFPSYLDDYVHANHPIRALDAYIEHIDLKRLGYQHTEDNPVNSGQPAYPPGTLLKLYLYG